MSGACIGGALLAASPAFAQSASAPLQLAPAPSDDGLGEPGALLPFSSFTPLRLSLSAGLFPIESRFPGCASREDASGNSVNGFPVERYSYLRLTPRLTLHGFSNGGCAVDAGLGSGLSYATPLGKNLWLVSSVGFYALPPPDTALSAVVSTSARVDLVKQLPAGHVLSFGLGTRNRTGAGLFNAVSFGGNF
ncbi:MAG: hypothetical protein ABW061_00965 [Polyangiaceae bacterium]